MTPLKFETVVLGPQFLKKGISCKTISGEISPYYRYRYILTLTKKKLGNFRLHFWFHRGHWPWWNRFWRLSKQLSQRIRSQMRTAFGPWIRALGVVDWWKNWELKISCNCPFKSSNFWFYILTLISKLDNIKIPFVQCFCSGGQNLCDRGSDSFLDIIR
jgi:hypothetical protein